MQLLYYVHTSDSVITLLHLLVAMVLSSHFESPPGPRSSMLTYVYNVAYFGMSKFYFCLMIAILSSRLAFGCGMVGGPDIPR